MLNSVASELQDALETLEALTVLEVPLNGLEALRVLDGQLQNQATKKQTKHEDA